MKAVFPALVELLNSGRKLYMTDLYTITLTNGMVLRYTSLDSDVMVGNVRFKAMSISRGGIRQGIGFEVDELSITMQATLEDALPTGVPILWAMRAGAFDGAILQLDRAFSPYTWQYMPNISPDYVLEKHFLGRMDVAEAGMVSATLDVKAMTELLNIKLPRNLITASCTKTVYTSQCGVDRAAFTVYGSVQAGSTGIRVVTGLTQANDWFNQGAMLFTSGNNTNVRRSVRAFSQGVFTLSRGLPYALEPGDTFEAVPGCDHTMATCRNKFNNLDKYRGQPFVPVPETIL